jgi:hypothetical protein
MNMYVHVCNTYETLVCLLACAGCCGALLSTIFMLGVGTCSNFSTITAHLLAQLLPATAQSAPRHSTAPPPSIPYLSDLIVTLMNLTGLHAVQQQQLEALVPTLSNPHPGSNAGHSNPSSSASASNKLSWKEFNHHFSSFLTWFSALSSSERSRDRMFAALNHDYSSTTLEEGYSSSSSSGPFSMDVVSSTLVLRIGGATKRGVLQAEGKERAKQERLSHRHEQLVWLIMVMQSVVFVSAKRASFASSNNIVKISPNWPLMSSVTKHITSLSARLLWVNRLIAILSLWEITTDAYDLFQEMVMTMLTTNVLKGSNISAESPSIPLPPWDEKSLVNIAKGEEELENENEIFDGSNEQLIRCKALEAFVKSFTGGEYFQHKENGDKDAMATLDDSKLKAYDSYIVDQLLGQYFAMFGVKLPARGNGGATRMDVEEVFRAATSMNTTNSVIGGGNTSLYYGQDCFVPIIRSFDTLLTKICDFSEKVNLMRLKTRIIRPKTGVMKLFVENSSFSSAMIAICQARICIERFSAAEAFNKLGILKTFNFLSDSAHSDVYSTTTTSGASAAASLTKNEYTLLLWYSIGTVYLPLLVTAFGTTSSGKVLKYSERYECFQVVCKGFDHLWTDLYEQATHKQCMLNQNVASGVLILLSSLLLYDSRSAQLKTKASQSFSSDDDENKLLGEIMQKIMDNVFNGLQIKQNVVNETCICLLQRITSDLCDFFYSSFRPSNTLNTEW